MNHTGELTSGYNAYALYEKLQNNQLLLSAGKRGIVMVKLRNQTVTTLQDLLPENKAKMVSLLGQDIGKLRWSERFRRIAANALTITGGIGAAVGIGIGLATLQWYAPAIIVAVGGLGVWGGLDIEKKADDLVEKQDNYLAAIDNLLTIQEQNSNRRQAIMQQAA